MSFGSWFVIFLNGSIYVAGFFVVVLFAVVLFKLNKALNIWLAQNRKQ